jgi:uncharacterized protein YodC (DUF2158 family)
MASQFVVGWFVTIGGLCCTISGMASGLLRCRRRSYLSVQLSGYLGIRLVTRDVVF